MNAGSDACPPMLVDYKKEKEENSLEWSSASDLRGDGESIAVMEADTGGGVS